MSYKAQSASGLVLHAMLMKCKNVFLRQLEMKLKGFESHLEFNSELSDS